MKGFTYSKRRRFGGGYTNKTRHGVALVNPYLRNKRSSTSYRKGSPTPHLDRALKQISRGGNWELS
jgi:hypothetical protein